MATINVKGFLEIPSLISNVPHTVSPLGQISNHSLTFSKDQDDFSNPDKDIANIIIFESLIGDTRALMPTEAAEIVFDIFEYAYVNFISTKTFEEQLQASFGSGSEREDKVTAIASGSEVLYMGKQFPTWLAFTYETATDVVNIKLWLSDARFRAEYDSSSALVIGPTNTTDELFGSYESVKAALSQVDLEKQVNNVEEKRQDYPFTKQRIIDLNWVDPNNSENEIKVNFFCLIYGPAGDTREGLLEAIRLYLLESGTHTLEEWIGYFPELLNVDSFIFIPQWDRVALTANSSGGVGVDSVYSQVVPYDIAMDNARKLVTDQTLTELKKVTDIFPLSFRSIAVVCIGTDNNSIGNKRFSETYPTYTIVEVNSAYANAIPAITYSAITKLAVLVRLCDEDIGDEDLPVGYTRSTINGAVFIESTENNIVFKMVTKASYLSKIGD